MICVLCLLIACLKTVDFIKTLRMIEGQNELKISTDGIFHVEPSANENENYGFSSNRDKKGERTNLLTWV